MQSLNSRNAKAIYSPNNKVPRFLVAAVQKYVILNLFYVSKHRTSELLEFVGKKKVTYMFYFVLLFTACTAMQNDISAKCLATRMPGQLVGWSMNRQVQISHIFFEWIYFYDIHV